MIILVSYRLGHCGNKNNVFRTARQFFFYKPLMSSDPTVANIYSRLFNPCWEEEVCTRALNVSERCYFSLSKQKCWKLKCLSLHQLMCIRQPLIFAILCLLYLCISYMNMSIKGQINHPQRLTKIELWSKSTKVFRTWILMPKLLDKKVQLQEEMNYCGFFQSLHIAYPFQSDDLRNRWYVKMDNK